jgi:ornithine cyclodeaminase/alanine dehydrogenase-like protein (mu-crystallin family)
MTGPIRYLTAADVSAAMPPVAERLRLAERTMTALVADAELPPKIGVHARPGGSFAHAMPAALRRPGAADTPGDADTSGDLLGIKWVTGFPTNREAGLPTIHATVVLNDPATGVPTAILDGGPITAERTAAVSGVAIARYAPAAVTRDGRPPRAAIIGAGVQGHSHLAVIGHVLPGTELAVHDRHPERAAALVASALGTPGIARAWTTPTARDATTTADVVITATTFTTPDRRGAMTEDWLGPDALVVAVDYATMAAPSVAHGAALFLVDDLGQFEANRDAGQFDGYPQPTATLGEAILAATPRPDHGRVLVTHLGVGLADVIFAAAIVERAARLGVGRSLTD